MSDLLHHWRGSVAARCIACGATFFALTVSALSAAQRTGVIDFPFAALEDKDVWVCFHALIDLGSKIDAIEPTHFVALRQQLQTELPRIVAALATWAEPGSRRHSSRAPATQTSATVRLEELVANPGLLPLRLRPVAIRIVAALPKPPISLLFQILSERTATIETRHQTLRSLHLLLTAGAIKSEALDTNAFFKCLDDNDLTVREAAASLIADTILVHSTPAPMYARLAFLRGRGGFAPSIEAYYILDRIDLIAAKQRGIPRLASVVADLRDPRPAVRVATLNAIRATGTGRWYSTEIAELISSLTSDSAVVHSALLAYGGSFTEAFEVLPAIVEFSMNSDAPLWTLETLARVFWSRTGVSSDQEDENVLGFAQKLANTEIVQLIASPQANPKVLIKALSILGGDPETATRNLDRIGRFLEHSDGWVRGAAIDAICRSNGRDRYLLKVGSLLRHGLDPSLATISNQNAMRRAAIDCVLGAEPERLYLHDIIGLVGELESDLSLLWPTQQQVSISYSNAWQRSLISGMMRSHLEAEHWLSLLSRARSRYSSEQVDLAGLVRYLVLRAAIQSGELRLFDCLDTDSVKHGCSGEGLASELGQLRYLSNLLTMRDEVWHGLNDEIRSRITHDLARLARTTAWRCVDRVLLYRISKRLRELHVKREARVFEIVLAGLEEDTCNRKRIARWIGIAILVSVGFGFLFFLLRGTGWLHGIRRG